MVLIPASSATSAILLAHAQLGNKAGELPFSFFFMHALSTAFFSQIQLSGHFMLLLHGPGSFQLFLSTGVILPLGLSLAAASFAMFCFSTGFFSNSDSPGSCLLLPDE